MFQVSLFQRNWIFWCLREKVFSSFYYEAVKGIDNFNPLLTQMTLI